MTTSHSEFANNPWHRLEALERAVASQGTSISTVVDNQTALNRRVEHLEALAQARAITEAREDERDKALYDRLDRMEDQIEETKTSLGDQIKAIRGVAIKGVGVFLSAFLVAAATFIIKGGLG